MTTVAELGNVQFLSTRQYHDDKLRAAPPGSRWIPEEIFPEEQVRGKHQFKFPLSYEGNERGLLFCLFWWCAAPVRETLVRFSLSRVWSGGLLRNQKDVDFLHKI